jgi:peptidoglycan/xylan/chitin deacetylase (PgdA/CDA1 family)
MKNILLFLLTFGIACVSSAKNPNPRNRELALTFDDCPRSTGPLMTGMDRAKKLVEELKQSGVERVAFFCNSPTREAQGAERIKYFAEHGHFIANHSANHPDLYTTPLAAYEADIHQAEQELQNFPHFRKWFRFPYLHEGKNPGEVDAVRDYLNKTGYKNGYITIDGNDWYIDGLLQDAIAAGKKFDQTKLCSEYKKIESDQAEFFDNMSVKALGRSVRHVILLHETDLNALCIRELISEFRAHGFKIISPELAYADPIAEREPLNSVRLDEGRVMALAIEKGYPGPFDAKWFDEDNIQNELKQAGVFY